MPAEFVERISVTGSAAVSALTGFLHLIAETGPVELEFAHRGAERVGVDVEERRGAARAFDLAARSAEGRFDVIAHRLSAAATATANDGRQDPAIEHILRALQGLRYGSVVVTVQDGVVVQIDRTEKNRLTASLNGLPSLRNASASSAR